MFVKNLEGLTTVVTVKKYIQPGEKEAQLDECRDEAKRIDTSKLEALLKERINMLERFIAQVKEGERLGGRDKSLYEGNVKETLLELQRIDEQIKRLTTNGIRSRSIQSQMSNRLVIK